MHPKHLRGLLYAHPPEVPEFHDFRLARIELRELDDRIVERDKRGRFAWRKNQTFIERKVLRAASPFFRQSPRA